MAMVEEVKGRNMPPIPETMHPPYISAMTKQSVLKELALGVLRDAIERGEMVPLGAPIGDVQLHKMPERITISAGAVDLLCLLAGFAGPHGAVPAAVEVLNAMDPPPPD
jgi:hypothetical protein